MCGICGILTNHEIDRSSLKKMNDTMIHRGPDDSGEIVLDCGAVQVGLAQRRLSIQDLSEQGHQPMCSPDGRIWIVFNGEIYNFKELKKKMPEYPFRSECDTEVILAMYQKYGIQCLKELNGMFAIAIYDRAEGCLYLARDRMGQKPLYYYYDGGQFLFASELKPFLAYDGFPGELNDSAIKGYLFHGYIEGPGSIFRNVWKLQPGTYLEYRGNEIRKSAYWNLTERLRLKRSEPITDYAEAKGQLKESLKKAVAYRMIADVPVGAFLSGGYDSSLITAIAQEQSSAPIKTYSIGFPDEKFDEAPFARMVAEHLGTDHVEYYITEQDIFGMLEGLTRYYDEPFADSSQIPTMLVAQLAARDVKVALSGDGGDELFCGYKHYSTLRKMQRLRPWIYAAGMILTKPPLHGSPLFRELPESVRGMMEDRKKPFKVQPFHHDERKLCGMLVQGGPETFFEKERELGWISDWQLRRMVLDMLLYLPDDILCKVDRATMKYSLEARSPLLDKNVVELSFALPDPFKFKDGIGKYILRDVAYDYIPRKLLERPKRGFAVPLVRWLRGPLRDELMEYTGKAYIERQGFFHCDQLQQLIGRFMKDDPAKAERYAGLIWHLYVLQKWYEDYRGKRRR